MLSKHHFLAGVAAAVGILALVVVSRHAGRERQPRGEPLPVESALDAAPDPRPVHAEPEPDPVVSPLPPPPPPDRRDAGTLVAQWRAQAPADPWLADYAVILEPPPPGLYKPQHDADTNRRMAKLIETDPNADRLARFFVEIILDPEQDVVLRDYAIQHLRKVSRALLAEPPAHGRETWSAATEMAARALFEVMQEQACCLAGTALLALVEMAGQTPVVPMPEVRRLALERAGDARTHDGIRATALLVCAQWRMPEALPVAWRILEEPDPSALRLAAISVIGALGDANAVERLNQMRVQASDYEKKALDAAICAISGRET